MQTQYFTRTAGAIAYDDSGGDGELVTLWPGIGDVRAEYRFLAPALVDAGYRVVSADLRGHGESSVNWGEYTVTAAAEDMLGLIDHLDAGPAHLIGTSFSPGAAVIAAAERPDAVRSLTLISAFVRDAPPNFTVKAFRAVGLRGPWKVAAWAWFYQSLYPTRKPDDFDAYLSALKANLAEPGRFEALLKLGFSTRERDGEAAGSGIRPHFRDHGHERPGLAGPRRGGALHRRYAARRVVAGGRRGPLPAGRDAGTGDAGRAGVPAGVTFQRVTFPEAPTPAQSVQLPGRQVVDPSPAGDRTRCPPRLARRSSRPQASWRTPRCDRARSRRLPPPA